MKLDTSFLQKKVNKGIELLNKKRFTEAIKIFNYLRNSEQTKTIGLLFLGIIQIQKKNHLLAEKFFFEVLEIDKNQ